MSDFSPLPFSFPAVGGKTVTAAFDGGRLASDRVMLLSMSERRLGIAQRLVHWFPDRRDPLRITHTLADMVRARNPGDRLRLRTIGLIPRSTMLVCVPWSRCTVLPGVSPGRQTLAPAGSTRGGSGGDE